MSLALLVTDTPGPPSSSRGVEGVEGVSAVGSPGWDKAELQEERQQA